MCKSEDRIAKSDRGSRPERISEKIKEEVKKEEEEEEEANANIEDSEIQDYGNESENVGDETVSEQFSQ